MLKFITQLQSLILFLGIGFLGFGMTQASYAYYDLDFGIDLYWGDSVFNHYDDYRLTDYYDDYWTHGYTVGPIRQTVNTQGPKTIPYSLPEPKKCKEASIPTCSTDRKLETRTDGRGCKTYHCVRFWEPRVPRRCPAPVVPQCDGGKLVPQPRTNGCFPGYTCQAKPQTCPVVKVPACPHGRLVQLPYENGCHMGYKCEITITTQTPPPLKPICPVVKVPACPDGRLVLQPYKDGCNQGYSCEARNTTSHSNTPKSRCPVFNVPDCAEGRLIAKPYVNGCNQGYSCEPRATTNTRRTTKVTTIY